MKQTALRRGVPFMVVAAWLVGLTLLAALVASVIYVKFLRYERVAALHVPEGSTTVIRFDVEQAVLYEPIRKHVLPALSQSFVAKDPLQTIIHPGRLERLRARIGLEFGVALREIVIAFGEGRSEWVVVFGGLFVPSGVVEAIDKVLREEGRSWQYSAAGSELVAPGGLTITQGADGVLILASSSDWARRARPVGRVASRLGLDLVAGAAFINDASGLRKLGSGPMAVLVPELATLSQLKDVRGTLSLDTTLALKVALHFAAGGDSSCRVAELEALTPRVRVSKSLVPAAAWLGPGSLERLRMVTGPDHTVTLDWSWDQRELDRTIGSAVKVVTSLVAAAAGEG